MKMYRLQDNMLPQSAVTPEAPQFSRLDEWLMTKQSEDWG